MLELLPPLRQESSGPDCAINEKMQLAISKARGGYESSLDFGPPYSIFVSEPLAASAGARAAAPSAPSLFHLRLRNERDSATGHQQGKRQLRIKFGFWANSLNFCQRACDSYHSRDSVCSNWTDAVVPEIERRELGLLVTLDGLADRTNSLIPNAVAIN